MRKIIIQQAKKGFRKVSIAERKGIGHPDTIMDSLCESASKALSKYYVKHYGRVLHHNLDKGLLIAGQSKPKFNAGEQQHTSVEER